MHIQFIISQQMNEGMHNATIYGAGITVMTTLIMTTTMTTMTVIITL